MDKNISMYINVEIERAEEISEPIQQKFDNEDYSVSSEDTDLMNYYQGYADAMRAVKNYMNR